MSQLAARFPKSPEAGYSFCHRKDNFLSAIWGDFQLLRASGRDSIGVATEENILSVRRK
jgi:hypothetical protein